MKTKKMKLTLNKRTISNLGNKNMKNVLGGYNTYGCDTLGDCVTWGVESCPLVCYSIVPGPICKGPSWYTDCNC